MNADAWLLLACRSKALVHDASMLMGALTRPDPPANTDELWACAHQAGQSVQGLLEALATAPELAAHLRTVQRFDIALGAWRRSVEEASPVAPRYQTALLQQAAQVVSSCLHVEALSTSESARVLVGRRDIAGRPGPPPP